MPKINIFTSNLQENKTIIKINPDIKAPSKIKDKKILIKYIFIVEVYFEKTTSCIFLSCSGKKSGVIKIIPLKEIKRSRTKLEDMLSRFFIPNIKGAKITRKIARAKLYRIISFS